VKRARALAVFADQPQWQLSIRRNACQDGADDFAIIRSFISTAKKRGWNVIHALIQEPQSLIASLGPA
jgi:hypothetical protein